MVPIEYSSVEQGTPLPKKMGTVWPSHNNKLNLEKLINGHFRISTPVTCTYSQGKLEKNLKQIPYQHILDIHRRIFRRVKSKISDFVTEIT